MLTFRSHRRVSSLQPFLLCHTTKYYIVCWRLGGKKRQLIPIGKSVSVSFRVRVVRACVRACEAVRVREAGVPNAGGSDGEIFGDSGAGFVFSFFNAICVGFKGNSLILASLAWVLRQIH